MKERPSCLKAAFTRFCLTICLIPFPWLCWMWPGRQPASQTGPPGDSVVVIGAGGKSGLLCLHEARKRAITGKVIGIAPEAASGLGLPASTCVIIADATDAMAVMEKVKEVNGGRLADVTINCVNIPHTELASILATRDGGTVYFFSMATSFTAAALGAEGVGKDVTMIVGNGYTRGHAAISLQIMRESPVLRKIFEELYV